ncbi:MAG: hypothetical protein IPI81_16415 [Flavobacteriales bacterium]|nr:hypothetical protein [Flavobacteriales bacterium]MCC6939769.1 hypothetical protein [Flavobacteriales bacterium]
MDKSEPSASLRIVGGQLLDARRVAMSVWGPHRMEAVKSIDDVLYVNDSRATFLDATLESLGVLDRRTVWIVGAWNADMAQEHVQELLRERVSNVVLFGPLVQGSEESLPEHVHRTDDLRMAVFLARELATAGEVVLFSPACPSSNGFANYEERGAEFKRAVKDL